MSAETPAIKVFDLNTDNPKVVFYYPGVPLLQQALQRALNTWVDAPSELIWLQDQITGVPAPKG